MSTILSTSDPHKAPMSFPFATAFRGAGECFVTCDCYSIRGDT